MNEKDKATERRGIVQLGGVVLAVLLVYFIGIQPAENAPFFILGGMLILIGIPLGCITWPPSENGRHFTPIRAALAALASVAAVVIASVIGYFYPEQPLVAPIIIGAGLLMIMFVQAP